MDLEHIRARIDALDDDLLRLLNERARLAAEAGRAKDAAGEPFYVPRRERAIVDRLLERNPGPLAPEAVRQIFLEVLSGCRALEGGLRVAYLGPEGTFTHMAAKYQFGLSARAVPAGTIAGVFDEVERGHADFGVVPVENSTEGVVNHTLDRFFDSDLKISAEIVLDVEQCLVARAGLDLGGVQRVYSHPQGLAQCRAFLDANLPRAHRVEASSTAEAARLAREDAAGAAVASELAADLHELAVLRRAIQDVAENATRFLVLGTRQAEPTGRDRTSLLVTIKDGPGVLFGVLRPFADNGLNLTRIESRPSRRRNWEYAFFLDVEGHQSDAPLQRAIAALAPLCPTIKLLGSYPRA